MGDQRASPEKVDDDASSTSSSSSTEKLSDTSSIRSLLAFGGPEETKGFFVDDAPAVRSIIEVENRKFRGDHDGKHINGEVLPGSTIENAAGFPSRRGIPPDYGELRSSSSEEEDCDIPRGESSSTSSAAGSAEDDTEDSTFEGESRSRLIREYEISSSEEDNINNSLLIRGDIAKKNSISHRSSATIEGDLHNKEDHQPWPKHERKRRTKKTRRRWTAKLGNSATLPSCVRLLAKFDEFCYHGEAVEFENARLVLFGISSCLCSATNYEEDVFSSLFLNI